MDENIFSESLKRAFSYLLIEYPQTFRITMEFLVNGKTIKELTEQFNIKSKGIHKHLTRGRAVLLSRLDNDEEAKVIMWNQSLNKKFPRVK